MNEMPGGAPAAVICQAFAVDDLRRFAGWTEHARPPDVCYLWPDLVVRASAIDPDQVVFDADSAAWRAFCRSDLDFAAAPSPDVPAGDGAPDEHLPFTSRQQRLVDELETAIPRYAILDMVLRVERSPRPAALERALAYLLARHDALRLRLDRVDGRLVQFVSDDHRVPLTVLRLSGLSAAASMQARGAAVADASRMLHRLHGPMLRFVHLDVGDGAPGALAVVVNHLLVDGFSQFVLVSELRELLDQAGREQDPELAPPTASFARWSRAVAAYVVAPEAGAEVRDYWSRLPWDRVTPMPVDFPEGLVVDPVSGRVGYGTDGTERRLHVSLGEADTETWLRQASAGESHVMDLLLTALLVAFAQYTGREVLDLSVVDSGRQPIFPGIDVLSTIGFIAHGRRLLLDLDGAATPEEALGTVRAQVRAAPNQGRTLEWLLRRGDGAPAPGELRDVPRIADLIVNYHGAVAEPLYGHLPGVDDESRAPIDDPEALRDCPLWFQAIVVGGQLWLVWGYSEAIHREATVQALADACLHCLRSLLAGRAHERSQR